MHASAVSALDYKGTGERLKEGVVDLEEPANLAAPSPQNSNLGEDGEQQDELLLFMQSLKEDNAALLYSCAANKAVCVEWLLELTAAQMEKSVNRKKNEGLIQRLAGALPVQVKRVV